MPELTHQKARALLLAAPDQQLGAQELNVLKAHLHTCEECSAYAKGLNNIESRLRNVMQAQWDKQRPSLDTQAILHPSRVKLFWHNVLSQTNAMGKVTIVTTLLLGCVVLANLFGFQLPITGNRTPTTVPTPSKLTSTLASSPTPAAQFTLMSTQNCETVTYIVQTTDTLESVARRFGIQKSVIMEYNNMSTEKLSPKMELFIPFCESTPTGLRTTASHTVTVTPLNGATITFQPE